MKSLKERSVSSEEMGMFWRDTELAWWWYHAPIETQALMIEAFDEVAGDQTSVENCKVWLLKQKQTTDWKTTKATADAVYSLLLRGTDLLSSDALVALKLDNTDFTPVVKGQAKANSNDNRKHPHPNKFRSSRAQVSMKSGSRVRRSNRPWEKSRSRSRTKASPGAASTGSTLRISRRLMLTRRLLSRSRNRFS
jgi:hypothetical protein